MTDLERFNRKARPYGIRVARSPMGRWMIEYEDNTCRFFDGLYEAIEFAEGDMAEIDILYGDPWVTVRPPEADPA